MGSSSTKFELTRESSLNYLSYFISEETPGFGGNRGFQRISSKTIAAGDSNNSFEFRMFNHYGTHIDLPKHFVDNGRSLSDYSANEFIFSKVGLLKYAAKENELLDSKILSGFEGNFDLILIQTGWSKFRAEEKYWKNNPGLAPELADGLRSKFPNLRAIGFDFISLTAFQHRELGRQSHRDFLGGSRPLMIIEDMKLQELDRPPKSVWVAPLLIDRADGGPVTILADV